MKREPRRCSSRLVGRLARVGGVALGIALLLLVAGPGAAQPSAARTRTDVFTATARSMLARSGYRSIHLVCAGPTGRVRCHFSAIHGRAWCRGELTVRRAAHRLRVVMGPARCRASSDSKPPVLLGFNTYTTDRTIAAQKQLGATTSRMFIWWPEVEPLPGLWSWTAFDQQYNQLVAAGLRPLIVAAASPCWAHPSFACGDLFFTGPPDPSYDGAWTDFIHRLAARYPRAIGIEIWNEPNLVTMFWPRVDPVRYTELLKEAYHTIKSVNPTMPVVSGGLLGSSQAGASAIGEGDKPFLAAMYAAGAGGAMDAIGIHPYPIRYVSGNAVAWDPAIMERTLDRLRAVRTAVQAKQPIWITEVGESTTTEPDFPPGVTPEQQGRDLQTMLEQAKADPDVPVVIVHTLQNSAPNLPEDLVSGLVGGLLKADIFFNQLNEGFGVFTTNWSAKPAACAVSLEFHGSLRC